MNYERQKNIDKKEYGRWKNLSLTL